MEAPVVHLSMIELEFKKRETQVGIPRLRNLSRVIHEVSSPTFEPDGAKHVCIAIPVPLVCGATAFLWKVMIDGNMCCHLVVIFWEITEMAYFRSVYFQTQKIPKEKNQLKALKNQVSERERA